MHEMGVVINMLQSLERAAKQNNVTAIASVSIELGEMTGVVPQYLLNCWPAAVDGTVCHRSELYIKEVRALANCHECNGDYLLMDNLVDETPTCPHCGSTRWHLKEGDQLVITEIAVKDD
jgi:hydrogenase nickel incorporation protein HypA/HybF